MGRATSEVVFLQAGPFYQVCALGFRTKQYVTDCAAERNRIVTQTSVAHVSGQSSEMVQERRYVIRCCTMIMFAAGASKVKQSRYTVRSSSQTPSGCDPAASASGPAASGSRYDERHRP